MEPSVTQTIDKKIADVTQIIETRLYSVLKAIATRSTEIQALSARVDITVERVALDQTTATSKAKITVLEKQVKHLQERIDQQDNHSRKCNIRLLGIEDQKEGTNAVKNLEKWIPEFLQLETADGRIVVDRGHHSQAPVPSKGQRPHPLIVKFHYYADKVRVMNAAHQHRLDGVLIQQNIHFFNNYSAEVVRKRKAYNGVKAGLRGLDVEYALLFPQRPEGAHRWRSLSVLNPRRG